MKYISLASMVFGLTLVFLDAIITPPTHLPDLFTVLNLVWSCGIFGLGWLWSLTRLVEEAWGLVGLGFGSGISPSAPLSSGSYRRSTFSPAASEYSYRSKSPNMDALAELDGEGDGSLMGNRKPRSSSVASSSRTATRRPKRSPMISPVEDLQEEHLYVPRQSSTSTNNNYNRQHQRSSSRTSQAFSESSNRHLKPSRMGNMSTQVSPSKTHIPGAEEGFKPIDMDVFGEKADLARWKQATMQDFR